MVLNNQRILIIGGSSGMGLASARRLAAAGAEVIIGGRDQKRLDRAVASADGVVSGLVIDMADAVSLSQAADRIARIDHLILAASANAAWGAFRDVSDEMLRKALDGKLIGFWRTLQAFLPVLRSDGSVVMLTGAASRTAIPGTVALAAVNGAITQMAQTLAKELAPLRVNVISPGLVDTPAYDPLPAATREGMFAEAAKSLPVGRVGQADDIAAAVEMLIGNGFVTGALLDVDGGARMAN